MKIDAHLSASFAIQGVTMAQIILFSEVAEHHYDGHCRRSTHMDGIFPRWRRHLAFHPEDDIPFQLSWSELDTLCKIGEMAPYHARYAEISDIIHGLHKAIQTTAREMRAQKTSFQDVGRM